MKKKFVLIIIMGLILILNSISSIPKNVARFTHKETNNDNYIHIGKLGGIFDNEVMLAYAAKGPALTFGVEIKTPYDRHLTGGWSHTSKLSNYPYHNWANNRKEDIVSALQNRKHPGSIPKNNINFSKKHDTNYFIKNEINFVGYKNQNFLDNQGLHIFVAICNNAHIRDNAKKIDINKEKNLHVTSILRFKGNTTGREWKTAYDANIDIYNDRYYVTTAYNYDKYTGKYVMASRGSWNFYNADLIIIDLGTSGHMEDLVNSWTFRRKYSSCKYQIFDYMKKPYRGEVDDEAIIIKANYHIKFTPSWDNSKILKQSILLGKDNNN